MAFTLQHRASGNNLVSLTVAIATHDRAHLIGAALQSCLAQTVRPEQVIVVDDGSSDDTASVVRGFNGLDVVYVNAGKIGLGNARNFATALCRSKYLCILDDDDIMLPNRIRDHMTSLADGAQMSHGGWINFNEFGELDFRPGKKVSEDVIVYAGGAITHGACCYLTSMLREFPYRSDLTGGVDFDLAVRMVKAGIACVHTGSYVLLRRKHQITLSSTNGSGQRGVRQFVVELQHRSRTDAEIATRQQAAITHGIPEAVPIPPLSEIYHAIGGPGRALRVSALVPRQAPEFFALLARLEARAARVEVFDDQPNLTSNVSIASRPATDLAVLGTFCSALQECGIKPSLVRAEATPRLLQPPVAWATTAGRFRLVLSSRVLKELHLAYRLLVSLRPWAWYVAVREVRIRGRPRPVYQLVSTPFASRKSARQQSNFTAGLKAFIYEHTNLVADVREHSQ